MGVPLAGDYDVLVNRPIDSRMVWTGNSSNLNEIAANGANRYPGMITYVTGDQNLYLFQGGGIWEKIVTTNVDSIVTINSNFTLEQSFNGQVIYCNNNQNITGVLPTVGFDIQANTLQSGYNVSFVQLGNGNIVFNNGGPNGAFFRNRLNLNRTAGKYAVVSVLRINTNEYLLYGDLI